MKTPVTSKDLEDNIAYVSEWFPLKEARGHKVSKNVSLSDTYGVAGCYQAICKKDIVPGSAIDVVDPRIGYTGKASNVFGRVMVMRRGKHSISAYNKKNFDNPNEEVYVRYIFPTHGVSYSDVEKWIHNITDTDYNQRFAWESGTSSVEGKMYRCIDAIDTLTTLEELREVAKYVQEKAKEVFCENWLEEE